jgi:hypothetical protein
MAMRQFHLVDIKQSADGQTIHATVHDRDWTLFTQPPSDVKMIGFSEDGDPIIRFPSSKLVFNRIIDFDR